MHVVCKLFSDEWGHLGQRPKLWRRYNLIGSCSWLWIRMSGEKKYLFLEVHCCANIVQFTLFCFNLQNLQKRTFLLVLFPLGVWRQHPAPSYSLFFFPFFFQCWKLAKCETLFRVFTFFLIVLKYIINNTIRMLFKLPHIYRNSWNA